MTKIFELFSEFLIDSTPLPTHPYNTVIKEIQ